MLSRLAHAARRARLAASLLLVAALVLGLTPFASAAPAPRTLKVMTYNMDAGTDFIYFFALPFEQAVQATYAELQATDFAGRAARLADPIAAGQPDLVSLQEATLWRTLSATGRPRVVADQLMLLMAALWSHHQFYRVVALQNLTTLTAPIGDGSYLSFLDRNVVLARATFGDDELRLTNIRSGRYQATSEPLPGFLQVNGWISLDAAIGGGKVRFFATHLESPTSTTDETQVLQGQELIQMMDASPFPVILAGDFNSDASGLGIGPDQTPTAAMIVGAGYADVWPAFYPAAAGLTWPLFLEDVYAGPSSPFERIDLVFAKGATPLGVQVVGTTQPFPSDHAGVLATLRVDR